MTYSGKVRPGGPPDHRDLARLTVTKLSVGVMDNNAYLLRCQKTDEQVLIDAADEADRLLSMIGSDGLAKVVTTHRHGDHWQGLAQVVAATGAETVAGADDVDGIPVATDHRVVHGDKVTVGECELEVIHLVGHTPGSIALLYDDPEGTPHLFTGDSLFPGGVGNTFGDVDAFGTLVEEVSAKVFDRLPDETWFYPGHGDDSTLGAERPHVPEWRTRGW
ncbi:MAG: MBL fold metallo-hydrolase [Actinomycetota bacterium]|nr:MBL fold metallo-hydrolase [Actinomycetota bacterium]